MKKLLSITVLVLGLICFSNTTAMAQSDFKLGAGLTYGSGVLDGPGVGDFQNDIGLHVDGYYTVTPEIRLGAGFTYYFPKDEANTKVSVWELGLNGNYIFMTDSDLMVYGIAGLGFTGVSADPDAGDKTSETVLGLNLGAGLEYAVDFGTIFGELSINNIGGEGDDFDLNSQFVLGAGLRFDL